MVEQVNKIVFNLLVSGRGVFLPTVGSLYTRYSGARLLSGRTVERGVREVAYTPGERGVSLVDAIAEAAGCDHAEAAAVYDRWLIRTFADQVLTIEGVGGVRQGRFMPDPALDGLLNPLGRTPLVLRRTGRRRWVPAMAIVLLLAAGCYGYMALRDPCGGLCGLRCGERPNPADPHRQAVAVRAGAPTDKAPLAGLEGDSLRAGDASVAGADVVPASGADPTKQSGPEGIFGADRAGAEASAPALIDSSADGPAVTDFSSAYSGPDGSDAMPVVPAETAGGGAGAEHTSATVPVGEDHQDAERSDGEPARMRVGQTYLVLGVYSTADNARRAAREAAAKHPDVTPRIYCFGEKFMVSIGSYPSREEAAEAIRAYGARFRGLWPYSKK